MLLVLTLLLAAPVSATAQLSISLTLDRQAFILYESIPVTVRITNNSGRPVLLEDTPEGRPWLSFQVTTSDSVIVPATGLLLDEGSLSVPPGQAIARRVDLLPLHEIRARGTYRAQAVLETGHSKVVSTPVRFHVTAPREIWQQTVGLQSETGEVEQYRTYTLCTRRGEDHDHLYVRVSDDAGGLIHGMIALGHYIPMGQPETRIDRHANLHLLFRSGPNGISYIRVAPTGQVVDRAVYTDYMSSPRLVAARDGFVTVSGGEKIFPRAERLMSDEELNPPPPPSGEPKKSRGLFGGRRSRAESGQTNAPRSSNFDNR
jgi:hypothetical protein